MTENREKNVILLISYEYVNYEALSTRIAALHPATVHVASKNGLGRVVLNSKTRIKAVPIEWRPNYQTSKLETNFDQALIFWDGQAYNRVPGECNLFSSAKFFESHHIPFTVIGPNAKEVAPATFYATFQGEAKMATRPSVIVDNPKESASYGNDGTQNKTRVRVTISIPEEMYVTYESQAKLAKVSVEKVLSDRLRQCVDHTSGRGLYFTDEQRSQIERVTGGHLIMDAKMALDRITTTVNLKVGDITVELSERVLARCASRARAERKDFETYVKKEVIQVLSVVPVFVLGNYLLGAKMAKQRIPIATSHDTDPEGSRPETDFEHSQRYLNDIDRNTWRGTHAPAKGAKGMVHKISVAENAPHIFKAV